MAKRYAGLKHWQWGALALFIPLWMIGTGGFYNLASFVGGFLATFVLGYVLLRGASYLNARWGTTGENTTAD